MDADTRLAEIAARTDAAGEGPWEPDGWEIKGPLGWVAESLAVTDYGQSCDNATFIANARQDIPFLLARVADLEATLERYVGKEPTVAEEMAYLNRCLNAVHT